jgi:hypothetical protein
MESRLHGHSSPEPSTGRGARRAAAAGGLLALAAGAWLRFHGLGEQVLTGDELHAVNAALSRSVGEILRNWTYFGADYSVPLTAYYRLLLDRGVVLGELGFRAPLLVASLATLLLVPRALRPRIGAGAALVLAWLVALSPMLVLYGRIVRSYALIVLLGFGALLAFERWWRTRSSAAAASYVGLAALATWLHLGAAPCVLSPFAFAALEGVHDRARPRATWLPLAGLALAVGGASALLLLPALGSLLEVAGQHGTGRLPTPRTWLELAQLQLGSRSLAVTALLAAAALRGAVVLARRERALAGILACAILGQVAGLFVLAPRFLETLAVANRYLLVALPAWLAFAAVGLATPVRPGATRAVALQGLAVAALLAALFATGPFAGDAWRWSSFTHGQPFLGFLGPGDRVPIASVPRFYRELPPGGEAIVEAPWANVGTHAYVAYQAVHRRPVRVASVNQLHADPRLALRNVLAFEPEALRRSGARFVVVHLDVRQAEEQVETPELQHRAWLEGMPELWTVLRRAGAQLAARLEEAWGPPAYSDASLRVWDLGASPAGPR